MEQHPVPQNVTNFQFKLIGDITLKQFGYLAGSILLGYLCTKISLIPDLLRWPIGGLFVILGFGLAFVPIEDRPLDRWLRAFFKSIYAPTQFIWKKQNIPPDALIAPLTQLPTPPRVVPVVVEMKKISPVKNIPQPKIQTPPAPLKIPLAPPPKPVARVAPPQKPKVVIIPKPVPPSPKPKYEAPAPSSAPKAVPATNRWTLGAPPIVVKQPVIPQKPYVSPVTGSKVVFKDGNTIPAPAINTKQVDMIKSQYQEITQKLSQQINIMQKEMSQGTIAKERFMELQQTLMQLMSEKERLDKEVVDLRQKLASRDTQYTETPSQYTQKPVDSSPTVRIIAPQSAMQSGIPMLTSQPNVITGIIKESTGALLPNLIVMVKDREGVPVRALKSNRLGQFAASTPLNNGTYYIEVEDPKKLLRFNRVEIGLSGKILPPLEITAISEKDLLRQKLSREIFGVNKI